MQIDGRDVQDFLTCRGWEYVELVYVTVMCDLLDA